MATVLKISEERRTALRKLAALPPKAVDELAALFSSTLQQLHNRAKVQEATATLKHRALADGVGYEIADALMPTLIGTLPRSRDVAPVAEALARATFKDNGAKAASSSGESRLRAILERVLGFGETHLKAKALGILGDFPAVLSKTAIYSDLRPVFSADGSTTISAMLGVHQLKITFMEGNEQKESYFALDLTDLKNLEKQIARAIEKSKVIDKLISATGVQPLRME